MHRMRFPFTSRFFGQQPEADEAVSSPHADSGAQTIPSLAPAFQTIGNMHPAAAAAITDWRRRASDQLEDSDGSPNLLKTLGWVSAGLGAIALGLVVGREIRQRYKFTRRTPYDFYAHAGDEHDIEFGVGI